MTQTPKIRLVMSSSRWGNLYRFRYYVDGHRVSYTTWKWRKNETTIPLVKSSQQTPFGYRDIWEGF